MVNIKTFFRILTGFFVCLSFTSAFAIELEVPPDISNDDLREMDEATFKYLYNYAYENLVVPEIRKGVYHDYDLVVNFTKDGIPISEFYEGTRDDDVPNGELTFGRWDGDHPWEDWQFEALWEHLYWAMQVPQWIGAYQLGKEVYGNPFYHALVYIKRDPNLPYGGMYTPGGPFGTITLNVEDGGEITDNIKGALTHEMLHAFLDGTPLWAQFSEGMATAGAIIIQTMLYNAGVETGYDRVNHNNEVLYTYHEFYNVSDFACPGNNFWLGWDWLVHIRYNVSSFVWWKMYCEDPDFFVRFNSLLYSNPGVGHGQLMDNARDAYSLPTLEGFWDIQKWLENQPIIKMPASTDGTFMAAIPYDDWPRVWLYKRSDGGELEEPVVGANVEADLFDADNNWVIHSTDITRPDGYALFPSPYGGPAMKRYRIYAVTKYGGGLVRNVKGHSDEKHYGVPGRGGPHNPNDRNMYGILVYTTSQSPPYELDVSLYDARTGVQIWGMVQPVHDFSQFYVSGLDPEPLPDFLQWRLTYRTFDPPYEYTICRNVDKATYFIIFNEYPGDDLDSGPVPAAITLNAPVDEIEKLSTRASISASGYGVAINYYVTVKLAAYGTATFEAFDLAGRKVFRTDLGRPNLGKNTYYLDVADCNLPQGVYIYRIKVGPEASVNKFVVTR